jgi:hypothetical protein
MANDFLLKSKSWIKENFNAPSAQEYLTSQTPSHNQNTKYPRLTHNTSTPSEKMLKNEFGLYNSGFNLAKNKSRNNLELHMTT